MENDENDVERRFRKVHAACSEPTTVASESAKPPKDTRSEPPFGRLGSSNVCFKTTQMPTESEVYTQRAEVMTKLLKQLYIDDTSLAASSSSKDRELVVQSASTPSRMTSYSNQNVTVRPASESRLCTLLHPLKEKTIRKHLNSIGVTIEDTGYNRSESSFKGLPHSRSYNVGNITIMEDTSDNFRECLSQTARESTTSIDTEQLSSSRTQKDMADSPGEETEDENQFPSVYSTFEINVRRKVTYPKSYIRHSWSSPTRQLSDDFKIDDDSISLESEEVKENYLEQPSTSKAIEDIIIDSNRFKNKSNSNMKVVLLGSLENLSSSEVDESDHNEQLVISNSSSYIVSHSESQDSKESKNVIVMNKFEPKKSDNIHNVSCKIVEVVEKNLTLLEMQKIIYASVNENVIKSKPEISYVPLRPVEESSKSQHSTSGKLCRKASKRKLELEKIKQCPKEENTDVEIDTEETPDKQIGLPSWAFVKSQLSNLEESSVYTCNTQNTTNLLVNERIKKQRFPTKRVSKSARTIPNVCEYQPSKVQSTPRMMNTVNTTEVAVHTVNKINSSSSNVSSNVNNRDSIIQSRHKVRSRQRRSKIKNKEIGERNEDIYRPVNQEIWTNPRIGEDFTRARELDDSIQDIEEDEIEVDLNVSEEKKVQCACFKSLGIAISQCIFPFTKRKRNAQSNS